MWWKLGAGRRAHLGVIHPTNLELYTACGKQAYDYEYRPEWPIELPQLTADELRTAYETGRWPAGYRPYYDPPGQACAFCDSLDAARRYRRWRAACVFQWGSVHPACDWGALLPTRNEIAEADPWRPSL